MGYLSSQQPLTDFSTFAMDSNLISTSYIGNKFTWYRKEPSLDIKWAKLDKFLINSHWGSQFPNCMVEHLPRMESNHTPILMKTSAPTTWKIIDLLDIGEYGPHTPTFRTYTNFIGTQLDTLLNP